MPVSSWDLRRKNNIQLQLRAHTGSDSNPRKNPALFQLCWCPRHCFLSVAQSVQLSVSLAALSQAQALLSRSCSSPCISPQLFTSSFPVLCSCCFMKSSPHPKTFPRIELYFPKAPLALSPIPIYIPFSRRRGLPPHLGNGLLSSQAS